MKHAPPQHHIQRAILETLRGASGGLNYARINTLGVENDLYNYHLQQLVKHGYVEKSDATYIISNAGKKLLTEINPIDETGASVRFKIAAMCVLMRQGKEGIEFLYQQRTRQPFVGQWECIGGGMQRGEPVLEAASRRVFEEAGMSAEFQLAGSIRKIRYDETGELFSDILYHVCVSNNFAGQPKDSVFGTYAWLDVSKAQSIEQNSPGGSKHLAKYLSHLASTDVKALPLFYFEELYSLKNM